MDSRGHFFSRSALVRGAALGAIGFVAFVAACFVAACNALVGLDDLEHVLPDDEGGPCSNPATDCPPPSGPCEVAVCSGAGACSVESAPVKTPCSDAGMICSAAGECVGCVDDADCAAPLTCGGGGAPNACGCDPPCHVWSQLFGPSASIDTIFASALDVDPTSGVTFIAGAFGGEIDLGKGSAITSAGGSDGFVAKLDPTGAVLWAKSFGDPLAQHGFGVAATGDGGAILTGSFEGSMTLGEMTLTSQGGRDPFVARLDKDGSPVWVRTSNGEGAMVADQYAVRVKMDASGNSIVMGYFSGGLNFGQQVNGADPMEMGAFDVFLVKFGPNGEHLWTRAFGDAKPQRGPGLAVDAAGNIYISGTLSGTVDFGGGACVLSDIAGAGEDIFAVKLGPDGSCVWAKSWGNDQTQYVQSIQVDGGGHTLVAGDFVGKVNFGSGDIQSAGDRDAFVLKLNENGALEWVQHYGDAKPQGAQEALFDGSGGILVAGRFSGSVDFGDGMLLPSKSGLDSAFLLKLEAATGKLVWRRGYGLTGATNSRGLELDGAGNVVLLGSATGAVDFGGGSLVNKAVASMFVAKFKL